MNVTIKPLNQLAIMHKRIKQNRPIKDCSKLLCHPGFLSIACKNLPHFEREQFTIYQQLKAVLTTPMSFMQLPRYQSSLILEVCLFFIQSVFVAEEIFKQEQKGLKERLARIANDWLNVNWVVTISVSSTCETVLNDYMRHLIADQRFCSLLKHILKKLQQEDLPRYKKLARTIFLTRQLHTVQNQFDAHILFDENKLIMGLESNKKEAKLACHQVNSSAQQHSECYFKHFSKPLLFKNYAIKRNWKLEKISIDVPQHMLIKLAHMYQYGDFHNKCAKPKGGLIHKPISEIHSIYQKEVNEIELLLIYAENDHKLNALVRFAKLSFIKTIALKQGCTFGQAVYLLRQRKMLRFNL